MTMPPAELERKVRRLDNDVQAIYELLATISATQNRHGNRLDELDARFDGIDRRLDAHDKRFDGIDARLDGHDKRFDGMDAKLDEILSLVRPR
jgi:hypothetical protein